MSSCYPSVLIRVPPPFLHSLQLSLIEKPQNARKWYFLLRETISFLVRVIKLIFQRTALLDCQRVGLPAELISHHLQVTGDQILVANIRSVSCE